MTQLVLVNIDQIFGQISDLIMAAQMSRITSNDTIFGSNDYFLKRKD